MNRDTRMDAIGEATPLKEDKMTLDRLTKSDYGPFLLLFCLFIAGFVIFAGGMILVIIGGLISITLLVLITIVAVVVVVSERWNMKNNRSGSIGIILNETEKWVVILGWFLPRKHREAILGDILEDCHEMRWRGLNERRIRTHLLWQWFISVVIFIPLYFIGTIRRLFCAK